MDSRKKSPPNQIKSYQRGMKQGLQLNLNGRSTTSMKQSKKIKPVLRGRSSDPYFHVGKTRKKKV